MRAAGFTGFLATCQACLISFKLVTDQFEETRDTLSWFWALTPLWSLVGIAVLFWIVFGMVFSKVNAFNSR